MAIPARLIATREASTRWSGDRGAVVRNRSHAVDPLTARSALVGQRPMVRATAGIVASTTPRPTLRIVPRRRRAARFLGVLCAVVVLAMLGAAAFQTSLAQRQLELDRLDRAINDAREGYEVLRQERAELRSPQRLANLAAAGGMVPAKDSTFVSLSPELMAVVQESVGTLSSSTAAEDPDPLEQFRAVKSLETTIDR